MKNSKSVVTARHGEIIRWFPNWKNPCLSLSGVWQAIVLGYQTRFILGMKKPLILTSHKRRCVWTARIIQLWFPQTWFRKKLQVEALLFMSRRAGDTVGADTYRQIADLMINTNEDVVIVTHHQLADGNLLEVLNNYPMNPINLKPQQKPGSGKAQVLNLKTGAIYPLRRKHGAGEHPEEDVKQNQKI